MTLLGRSSDLPVVLAILLALALEPNVASGSRLFPAKLVIRYHDPGFGLDIPGSIQSEQATAPASPRRQTQEENYPPAAGSPPKFLEGTTEVSSEITAPAASPRRAGVAANATLNAVSHSAGERIAIVVVIVFFVASIGALVLYVCKTRKFIEQRRAASLARSIEQGFGPRSLDQDSMASSSGPSSPRSYSPPHPQNLP